MSYVGKLVDRAVFEIRQVGAGVTELASPIQDYVRENPSSPPNSEFPGGSEDKDGGSAGQAGRVFGKRLWGLCRHLGGMATIIGPLSPGRIRNLLGKSGVQKAKAFRENKRRRT